MVLNHGTFYMLWWLTWEALWLVLTAECPNNPEDVTDTDHDVTDDDPDAPYPRRKSLILAWSVKSHVADMSLHLM